MSAWRDLLIGGEDGRAKFRRGVPTTISDMEQMDLENEIEYGMRPDPSLWERVKEAADATRADIPSPEAQAAADAWGGSAAGPQTAANISAWLGALFPRKTGIYASMLEGPVDVDPLAIGEVNKVGTLAKIDDLGFYSKLEDEILKKMGNRATPQEIMGIARNVKRDELEHLGIPKLLEGRTTINKDDLISHIRANLPNIEEKTKSVSLFPDGRQEVDELVEQLRNERINDTIDAMQEQGMGPGYTATKRSDGKWTISDSDGDTSFFESEVFESEDAARYAIEELESDFWSNISIDIGNEIDQAALEAQAMNRLGIDGELARFESHISPGGKNYQEGLLTLPTHSGTNFNSGHWKEPNVLVHTRNTTREVPAVGKTLHSEEIQSDWHQHGRRRGYLRSLSDDELRDLTSLTTQLEDLRRDASIKKDQIKKELVKVQDLGFDYPGQAIDAILSNDDWATRWDVRNEPELVRLGESLRGLQSQALDLTKKIEQLAPKRPVPDAPFKSTWHELMIKRLLHKAAKEGYDALSLSPADVQVERWGDEGLAPAYKKNQGYLESQARSLGAEYGIAELPESGGVKAPYVKLTPEIRDKILKNGFPLFMVPWLMMQQDNKPESQ